MSGYIGPIPVPQGIQNKETFTATAGQTTFNTNGYTDGAFISVYLNGVRLINGTDYTATNGSDVVLASAAAASDVVDFESFNSFSLASQQFENITTKNPTHEDTDGGRESALSFQGEQSGGEISTLAVIQASHDGTADDQKGDLIFKTNDGSDNNAPTERLRIDSDGSITTATLGTDNVHLGEGAGAAIVSGGNNNVAIGKDALASNTTADNSTAVGFEAGTNSTGAQNTFFGRQSGKGVTSGTESVFIGNGAGRDGTQTGDYNIGIGSVSLNSLTSGHSNIAIGRDSLGANTTGVKNVVVGYQAADAITDGEMNVAIGNEALSGETGGDKNVAVGASALKSLNTNGAAFNTAVGTFAGTAMTTGTHNTFIGGQAGDAITTSNSNTAVGKSALSAETSSNGNTAVGEAALGVQNVGGSGDARNTAVGLLAGAAVTTGTSNTFLGALAGDATDDGTGNTAVGYSALSANCGDQNTALGFYAGLLITGVENTCVGHGAGENITSGSQNICIGHDAGSGQVTTTSDQLYIARSGAALGTDACFLYGGSNGSLINGDNSSTFNTVSDERIKKNIVDSTKGLAEILQVKIRNFEYRTFEELDDNVKALNDGKGLNVLGKSGVKTGVIAQELETVFPNDVTDLPDGTKNVKIENTQWALIKAVQELSAKNDALESENTAIKARLDALEAE